MGAELGGDSCSGHKIPHFRFVFEAVKASSVCAPHVATPCTTAPEDGGLEKQHHKTSSGVCVCVFSFFLVKSHLSSCTT